jgi:hypothetical protein
VGDQTTAQTSVSPFDTFILELQGKLWSTVGSAPADEQDRLGFLIQQLGLLREAYISLRQEGDLLWQRGMIRAPGTVIITFEEATLEQPRPTRRIFLDYHSFISVLCQFSRTLPRHYPGAAAIPRSRRIQFYRNKVVEHWDDYVAHLGGTGTVFQQGKAPVPISDAVHVVSEREALMVELTDRLKKLGTELRWDDSNMASNLGADAAYCEAVFSALEALGPDGLSRRRDPEYEGMITCLLRLGFPVPVLDVEAYADELCDHVRRLVM